MAKILRKRIQLFRHATTWSNYVTIAVDGIQLGEGPGTSKKRAIWLHRPDKTTWAILHTMQQHRVDMDNIIVLEVALDRDKVKRHGHALWYIEEAIPASAIRNVYRGERFAASVTV